MKIFRIATVIIFLTTMSFQSLAQQDATKSKLAGSWIYAGLENKSPVSEDVQKEQEKADRLNKGLIITFEANGKYSVWKKVNNKKEVLTSGLMKLTRKGRHLLIDGLEGDIYTLTNDILKLSSPDHPIMVFKSYRE